MIKRVIRKILLVRTEKGMEKIVMMIGIEINEGDGIPQIEAEIETGKGEEEEVIEDEGIGVVKE